MPTDRQKLGKAADQLLGEAKERIVKARRGARRGSHKHQEYTNTLTALTLARSLLREARRR